MPDSDDDATWLRRILDCASEAARWQERVAVAEVPETGSRLDVDDRAFGPTRPPLSTIVWCSIQVAVDNLGLIADVLSARHFNMRPFAYYSLTRSATLGAAQAIWLQTDDQSKRVRRARMIMVDEKRNYATFIGGYVDDPYMKKTLSPVTLEKLTAARARVNTERHSFEAALIQPSKKNAPQFESTAMLRDVAKHVSPEEGWLRRAFAYEWHMASGDSHARIWTRNVRSAAHTPDPTTGEVVTTSGATLSGLGQAIGSATLLTREAFRLWDEGRATTPPS